MLICLDQGADMAEIHHQEAYRLANEAGRDVSKQFMFIAGALLAGYIALLGSDQRGDAIIQLSTAPWVIALLAIAFLFAAVAMVVNYLMLAARARAAASSKAELKQKENNRESLWERVAIGANGICFILLIVTLAIIIQAAVSHPLLSYICG